MYTNCVLKEEPHPAPNHVKKKKKNIKTANLPNLRAHDSLQFRIFLVTSEKNNVQKKKKKD